MENEPSAVWLKKIREIIDYIEKTQMDTIKKAANAIANSITKGHFCYIFGSGHSHMFAEELFPRLGGIVGMCPILSSPLGWFTRMIGDLGKAEALWLEGIEEYGKIILKNYYNIDSDDCMIVCSNSGANPVPVEVALGAKEKGATVIAVTSVGYSKSIQSKHSSGKKLLGMSDIVIDNGVPSDGDVVVEIPGLTQKVGPVSSVACLVIADLLSCEIAQRMIEKGVKPMIQPLPGFTPSAKEIEERNFKEFRRMVANHLR